MTRVGGTLLLIAFMGCAARTKGPIDLSHNGERFISEGWILGETRAAILKRLGPPIAIHVDKIKNWHNPEQIDEQHVFQYEGLTLAFYLVKEEPEREFLTDISVTSPRYALGWGLRVGQTKNEIVRHLGDKFTPLRRPDLRAWMPAPDRDCEGEVCTYRYSDHVSEENRVYFSFRNGRVSRIDWVFWVD